MNMRAMRTSKAQLLRMALTLTVLGGGAGCNAISGVQGIDFTRAPDAGVEGKDGGGADGSGGGGLDDGGGVDGGGVDGGDGGGGPLAYDLTCGPGNVAIGLYGRSGAWIDNLGLLCAPLHPDGTLGATLMTSSVGGDGGSVAQASCAMNQVLVGVEIWSDANLVYGINLLCQTIAGWKVAGAATNTVPGFGGSAGQKAALVCPPSTAFHGVTGETGMLAGWSGQYVLKAQFNCVST